MNDFHRALRRAWNVEYDENELRWCVFGTNPEGEEDWVELAFKEHADMMVDRLAKQGYSLEAQQLTRGEIRRRFGEPSQVSYVSNGDFGNQIVVTDCDYGVMIS